jgi:hypothetical protein
MRRSTLLALVLAATLLPAGQALAQKNFQAHLTGEAERPVPRETQAQGQAIFQVNGDDSISFRLLVANIDNVFAAHIHCGGSEVAGPVGVTLFSGSPGSGRVSGTLSEGTITAPDPGNACGWADLGAVIAAMEAGTAYVNVHTNDGVAPPNTGPGDFPGGEIRGQL